MALENVEDIYKLSPVQQGMLFSTLYAPESGAYFHQLVVPADMQEPALRAALQRLVDRHPVLRTSFLWEDLDEPVQVVHRRVELPIRVDDFSDLDAAAQRARLEELRAGDRRQGFDLTRAPLTRVTLVRRGGAPAWLMWSFHHLLLDGWSIGVILRELPLLYQAASQGVKAPLAPARPFRDYVRWLHQQDLGKAEAYWREALAGMGSPTPLGIDRAAKATVPGELRWAQSTLPPPATAALRDFLKRHRLTLPTVVQGAWTLALAHFSGQDDVVYGLTVSGRPAALRGVDAMVGCFINTLPVRARVVPAEGRVPWLRRLQSRLQAQSQYEHSPLVEIRKWSGLPGDQPLFETILVFEAAEATGSASGGPGEHRWFQRTDYPLAVHVHPGDETLFFEIAYDAGRFDATAVARLLRGFVTLLAGFAEAEDALGRLDPLDAAARQLLLREWNDTAVAEYRPACLHHAFEAQVDRAPGAVALVFEGAELTYRELDEAANRLAHRLIALGVAPEDRVGVMMERSPEMVTALLAVVKAGGAYVPIDPSYPEERIAFMLEDFASGLATPVVLTQAALAGRCAGRVRAVAVDAEREALAAAGAGRPRVAVDLDGAAYVIYTSGSTGRPKGTVNSYRGISNRLLWMQAAFGLGADDRVLQKTPFSFDVSVWEFFWPLLTGARLVVARPGGHQDAAYLARLIREAGVTTLHFVPSMLQVFVEEPEAAALGSLRRVIASGEALPHDLVERFHDRLGATGAELHNLYGPTEAAVDVTWWACPAAGEARRVPIGRPIANTTTYVLDRRLRPVAAGVAGELCLGGVQLARGYLGRPGLTAEKFVPDPYAEARGRRLYKTGDLTRWLADGEIEYLGRTDFQVKLRGFRIELGEIETALLTHPAVREAAVLARDDASGDLRLVAYLTAHGGSAPAAGELAAHLGKSLPEHMVPAAFVVLDALPLSPNGKLDRAALGRKALPAPSWGGEEAAHVAPRNAGEEILAGLFSQLLGVERVGVHDNFFRLGGHSLLATQVVSRVRRAFGVELELRRLFEAPTVAALAAEIAAASAAGHGVAAPPITPVEEREGFPLSFAQERLWFLDRLEPGSSTYNVPTAVRLEGRLDVPALAASLDELTRRHETLRTRFAASGSWPVQVIDPPGEARLPLVDLGALPAAAREAELRRRANAEARRPFDLERGPLLRVTLLRLAGDDDHAALIGTHHIVSDDWSMGILIRELATLYAACREDRPSPLPALPIQYADFAVWQRGWLQGEVLERQLAYWKERLAGAPALLELGADRPRPPVQSGRGDVRPQLLPAELMERVAALSQRHGTTRYMTLLAAFMALLARFTGRRDVLAASAIAGRDRAELEGLIGLFLNTVAIRVDLAGDPDVAALLERIRSAALGAYSHQDLPFEKLVDELRPERNLSHAPIVQVLFQQFQARPASIETPGLRLHAVEFESLMAKYDLAVNLLETPDGLRGVWRYNTDLFDAATVDRMAACYATLLAGLVDGAASRRLSELPILTAAERELLFETWNATARPYPEACLHHHVEAQVDRTPRAPAVTFEERTLTYRELDEAANRLARRLLALGVQREDRVGVMMERSSELVIALLAVLKAGAAYVPLDPSYPEDRLGYMMDDYRRGLAAPVLLTHAAVRERLRRLADEAGVRVLDVDAEREAIAGLDAGRPAVPADLDQAAYAIYTSGSTGRPKGTVNSHRGISNRLVWMQEAFGLGADDAVLQKTPFSFDVSVWEFFWPLMTGARLVVARPEGHRDAAYLVRLIRDAGVTTLHFVPSMLQLFVEEPGAESLVSLGRVIASGEALPVDLVERFHERLGAGGAELHNLYGPTEAAVDVTWWRCPPDGPRKVPIGKPIANATTHVLDKTMRAVPVGVAGELCLGGVQLARGYLGRPGLTAERFVPDPYAARGGSRLYKTGDLTRWLPSGDVEYLGRLDFQVKVRGFRIELGEIEEGLARHEAVREAVVLALGEPSKDVVLVAFVVAAGPEPALAELRSFLARSLPDYMLPSGLVTLATMPLTANGKVDRAALAGLKPTAAPARAEGEAVAPRTPVEVFLAERWRELLGLAPDAAISVHDDFFELGGNSIRGAVLINRLQRELGEVIQVVTIFDHPTLAAFADYLATQHRPAVAKLLGEEAVGDAAAAAPRRRVDAARVAELRSLVRPLAPLTPGPRNRRAVFVLAPPRSGTTLLRVMLAGHPGLFAPPELELLSFTTMGERRAEFSGRESFWLEGAIRAVMEARGCEVDEARRLVEACEEEDLTTQAFYGRLQEWLGERVLVDKTPSYAFDREILERAEACFEEPLYVHLLRHPYGMVFSFEEAKLDQIFFRRGHPFERRELAELLWTVSHQNVLGFLDGIPERRRFRLSFEELVRAPRRTTKELCRFLGVDFDERMTRPYDQRSARMTDGLHAESRMLGDVKFHQHRAIDPGVAESWRAKVGEDFLGDVTWDLAAELGYPRPVAVPPLEPVPRDGDLPLSYAQERLWFLDQLEPESSLYNLALSVRLRGRLEPGVLQAALAAVVERHEALRTTFENRGGRPVQVVARRQTPRLGVADLGGLPAAARRESVLRLVAEEEQRPFDLRRGPLLRATLLRLDAEEHVLLLTLHHVVADGWSLGVLVRDLAVFFRAFAMGEDAAGLPELPVQYADFAHWQRRWLDGDELERQVGYWRRRLAGVPALELPTDRPRPRYGGERGGTTHPIALPAKLAAELDELGRLGRTTPFMALLAAFSALLARYSGQRDFAVGSVTANRNRPEIEELIGFFVNTLVLRTGLGGDPSFRELLARARETTVSAYAHQDVPLQKLVEELDPERGPDAMPFFRVMLVTEGSGRPMQPFAMPELTVEPIEGVSPETSKFDLTLLVRAVPGGLGGWLAYKKDLFDAGTVARLASHFETLLAGALADPDRPLAGLPLLAPAERHQLAVEFSGGPGPWPAAGLLHELIEAQVRRTPTAVALRFEGESLTYGELDARAGRLARRLREMGVAAETLVGVCLERSFELVTSLLAILKAGGAYLPLDPKNPRERLEFMIDDAAPRVILTRSGLLPLLPERALTVLDVGRLEPAEESAARVAADVAPESPAYVIYTSGSTGRPKGVVVSHRSAARRLLWAARADLDAGSRFLHKTNISFDVSVAEVFSPLIAGGRVVIARPGGQRDVAYLGRLIADEGVTDTSFPPTILTLMLGEEGFTASTRLRKVITGGETVPPELPAAFHAAMASGEVVNRYGPTEATISVSEHRCRRGARERSLPIGRPIGNAEVLLLDRRRRLAPMGVPGEICLGGPGVARGYLRRPARTAESFVPHLLAAAPGGRLYASGDLGRWRADGALEFLGRVDQQVKIRGFRVELGEIEAALAAHPAVRENVVVLREDRPGERALAAYVVSGADPRELAAELRQALAEKLPEHMVPAAFVTLDALPLTPTGKVDRRALPEPTWETADYAAPRTPTEEVLAGIWTQLLRVERVGTGDDFFALGGHSLLATQLVSRVRDVFAVELELRRFFEASTLGLLAAEVDAALAAGHAVAAPPIRRADRGRELPLSFAQERLWFLDRLEPGRATYNVGTAVVLEGALDVAALAAGYAELVRRHEVLRTSFCRGARGPVQAIAPRAEAPLPVIDLTALPAEVRERELRRRAAAEARRPFDLERGPLLRMVLVRLAAGAEHAALLTMHHIVSDEWSMRLLVRELAALYGAGAEGRAARLPELAIQYADYAVWQREWLAGEVLEGQLAWWRRQLAGVPTVLELPTDRPRPAVQSGRGGHCPLRLPAGVSSRLAELARRSGATVYMTLLAVFAILLKTYTGRSDVVVGSPIAGRNRSELEGLIGFFINTLVLRADLIGDPTFAEALARVRTASLGAYAHQDLPFEKLVEELQPERSLSHAPLVQVVFQQLQAPAVHVETGGLTIRPLDVRGRAAKFDLVVNVLETPDGLRGMWLYSADLFDATTVRRMSRHFAALAESAVDDPSRPLSHLRAITAAERHQLLLERPPSPAVPAPRSTLHALFAARAAERPEATAVICDGERLTYGELDRRSSLLARYLRGLGVGRETLVALYLDRSTDLVTAILGVLRAGGAYVPLDPVYPEERVAFVLADTAAPLLLTQERLRPRLPALGASVRAIALDREWERIASAPASEPAAAAEPGDLAYVIYTSGSTGKPKGVGVTHGHVVRLLAATEPWYGFGSADVWTLFHSYAFDFSVWETWGALAYGGRLVVVPYWVSRSPENFVELTADAGVTVLNQTPSAFRQFARAALAAGRPLALRWVVFGGEALDLQSLAPWFERYGDARPRLVNMYGITETTVHVTWRPLDRADVAAAQGSVIGRALPDLDLYVLDGALRPSPAGVPGEIFVGGAGVARGYLNRPPLTARRFLPDPYSQRPGARLYRSGDLARRRGHDLEYLGRVDHQVQLRGFRVELGEVEEALARHPAVREAVVLARGEGSDDAMLVAYAVRAVGAEPALGELRAFLARSLPDYMLPSALVTLDELPLTAHGKVDRRALPEPTFQAEPGLDFVAPRNDLERFLAALWKEMLGLGEDVPLGLHDDFFELGGSSIRGAVLVGRLQQELGEVVQVVTIFDHSTLAAYGDYLVAEHPRAVARLFGEEAVGERAVRARDRVDAARLARFRGLVSPLAPREAGPRNGPAIFVLAPPRSGTTLLRVMLGGHPRLFAPPELELLSFNTMAERAAAFSGRDAFWLEGLIRAVMEIRGCDAGEARRLIAEHEAAGAPTQAFYGVLQEWLGPRLLVDKTPSYTLDPEVLRRAEAYFDDAVYVHLVRHPYGMIRSFEEAKLDQIFFRREHPFERRELAELIWLASHRNVLGFLAGIPERRRFELSFEELVRRPRQVMERLCEHLGLGFDPRMVEPYEQRSSRMTDGVHAESRMLGDVKFHQHRKIDAGAAESWRQIYREDFLGEPTWELARRLGYREGPAAGPLVTLRRGADDAVPLFCVHPAGGNVHCYSELARALGPEQPVYGLQARGLHASETPQRRVGEMADHYLRAVRGLRPEGPYALLGWSLGGVVAYEMACRLGAEGHEVFLVMLDTFARAPEQVRRRGQVERLTASLGVAELVTAEDLAGLDADEQLELVLKRAAERGVLPSTVGLTDARRYLEVFDAGHEAYAAYEPPAYSGAVTFLRASEPEPADETLGWRRHVTGELRVHAVPGPHRAMVSRPHVEVVAARVAELLRAPRPAPQAV